MTNKIENWDNYDYVLQRVAKNGLALYYASDELRNNKEIVLIAVAKDGYALAYASDELRNDPEIVKVAVAQNGDALMAMLYNLQAFRAIQDAKRILDAEMQASQIA